MAKIAVTPTIVLAEFMLFQKTVSCQKVHLLIWLLWGRKATWKQNKEERKMQKCGLIFLVLTSGNLWMERNFFVHFLSFNIALLWVEFNFSLLFSLPWQFHLCRSQVVALTIVSIGVAVATVTDLEFLFFGACIALAWIIPSAVNKILWSNLQQQENWTALAYVSFMNRSSLILRFFYNTISFPSLPNCWVSKQFDVEDNSNHSSLFGCFDALAWPPWCSIIRLELLQHISYFYVSCAWLPAPMVGCFSSWVRF